MRWQTERLRQALAQFRRHEILGRVAMRRRTRQQPAQQEQLFAHAARLGVGGQLSPGAHRTIARGERVGRDTAGAGRQRRDGRTRRRRESRIGGVNGGSATEGVL
jgi:hypothetical protein